MRERDLKSAARWAGATAIAVAGAWWALNPPESSARNQLKGVIEREQLLSDKLFQEGALGARIVFGPILLPAWDVQVVDASNPRIAEVGALLSRERELSQQIAEEQGPVETPLRSGLGVVGPILSLVFSLRTLQETVGFKGRSQA